MYLKNSTVNAYLLGALLSVGSIALGLFTDASLALQMFAIVGLPIIALVVSGNIAALHEQRTHFSTQATQLLGLSGVDGTAIITNSTTAFQEIQRKARTATEVLNTRLSSTPGSTPDIVENQSTLDVLLGKRAAKAEVRYMLIVTRDKESAARTALSSARRNISLRTLEQLPFPVVNFIIIKESGVRSSMYIGWAIRTGYDALSQRIVYTENQSLIGWFEDYYTQLNNIAVDVLS